MTRDGDQRRLEEFAEERETARFAENQELLRQLRAARAVARAREEEAAELRGRLRVYEALDEAVLSPPDWLVPTDSAGGRHVAIPSIMVTDIHWGERVRPEEVGGVNAYDTTIAEARIKRAAEGAIKVCSTYLAGLEYEGLQLCLGGDLLSGEIHRELRESNVETTTESVVGVLEALVAAVRMLADYFERIHVAAVVGNHGRTTRRTRSKRKARDNYDWLVYQLLARELRADDRVTVQVADAADLHFRVYDTRYCLTHGDQFRGGTGIAASLSPLLLGVHRKRRRDAQVGSPWDVLVLGHFHETHFMRDFIVGGSIVGYSEYAYQRNLNYEPASAALWLTTPERGITFRLPVEVQDPAQEGWG